LRERGNFTKLTHQERAANKQVLKKNFYKEASIWGFFSSFLHPYFQVTDRPLKDQLQQEQDTRKGEGVGMYKNY